MTKSVNDLVLDGAFEVLDAGNIMTACSALPTTRTEAITTYKLADIALTPVTDFTKADGDTNGRKCTIAQKAAVDIDTSGTAINIAVCDGTNLLYVTECTSQVLTAGGTVTFPAWDIEIADPT